MGYSTLSLRQPRASYRSRRYATLIIRQLKGAEVALYENDPSLLQFQTTRRHCANCDKVDHFLALLPSSNIATPN